MEHLASRLCEEKCEESQVAKVASLKPGTFRLQGQALSTPLYQSRLLRGTVNQHEKLEEGKG